MPECRSEIASASTAPADKYPPRVSFPRRRESRRSLDSAETKNLYKGTREKSLNLTIRRATERDNVAIADFGRKTFEMAFGLENNPEDMRFYLDNSFSVAQITHELADQGTTFLMAYDNEILAGYAKLHDGPPPDCVSHEKAVQLSRLYVTSHHMGRGVGSQLIQTCIEEASRQGYETVWLGVWEKNLHAQRLYRRFGFVRVGVKNFVLGTDVQQDAVYARSL